MTSERETCSGAVPLVLISKRLFWRVRLAGSASRADCQASASDKLSAARALICTPKFSVNEVGLALTVSPAEFWATGFSLVREVYGSDRPAQALPRMAKANKALSHN